MSGFEDLLPAELTSVRRPAPAPMRPGGGSPPKQGGGGSPGPSAAQQQQPSGDQACTVDGVPDSVVDAWFREADADGDGRVADSEARAFFLTSGLAPQDLSKIWQLVKSPDVIAREGKGLSRYRFAQVLRLIALAQASAAGGHAFTPENTSAALHPASWLALHGKPLPPPRIGSEAQRQEAAAAAVAEAEEGPSAAAAGVAAPPASPPGNPFAGGGFGEASQGDAAQQQRGAEADAGAAPAAPAVPAMSAPGDLGPPPAVDDDDDLFGLKALCQRAASHGAVVSAGDPASAFAGAGATAEPPAEGGAPLQSQLSSMERRLSRSTALSSRISSRNSCRTPGGVRVRTNPLEPPVAFEARLPPLQPKVSAKLSLLAAANGSLFAGPAVGGGLLQWGRPEGNMRRPLDVDGQHNKGGKLGRLMSDLMYTHTKEAHVDTEDSDAAPAIEVSATDRGRTAACVWVDEAAALLWVADKEGWVYAYDVGGEPSMSLRAGHRAYQFQAHRVGHVTAICRTPQGELWTGSSRGSIRVWELGEPALVGEAPEPPRCRELRKGYGERAHSGAVVRLVCPADGQLVWSASAKGVLLWDAACGAFIGLLQRPWGPPGGAAAGGRLGQQPSHGDLASAASLGLGPAGSASLVGPDREALRWKIDGSKGLETDPITGYVVARPPASEWGRIAADQEAWAAQTDNNLNELMERVSIGGSKVVQGAGKAVKLLGKLARGLGGGAAPEQPKPAPAAGRQPSSGALVAPAAAAADEDGGQGAADGSVGGIVELLAPPDGSVWVAHKCGMVDRYSPAGKRLGGAECGAALTAAACVGQRVWLGFSDGMISIRDADGAPLKVFQAHSAGLLAICQAGSRTFSLAADGSLKGWSSAVPHAADVDALVSWDEQACGTYRRESLRCLCVTWNVGESKPEPGSPFFRWVHEAAFDAQLAVVGLQEIEMGSSSVALAAAKDAFSQRMQERGNTNAKFWSAGVLGALGGERHWHQVGLRQLSGMLIMVFARAHLKDVIGEVTTASVACGVLGVGGNKGAVAVEFSVHRRKVAVLCSHFAAHQGAVEARNANYATICRQLTFSRRAWYDEQEGTPAGLPSSVGAGGAGSAAGSIKGSKSGALPAYSVAAVLEEAAAGDIDSDADSLDASSLAATTPSAAAAEAAAGLPLAGGEGMRGAHMLVWLGDFNYRIDGSYEAVKEAAIRNELGVLLEMDQCRREMAAGRVFRGLREGGPLAFRPTYKFDKSSPNPFAYDTSEKRRIPAWCDRILFRGSVPFPTPEPEDDGDEGLLEDEEEDVTVRAIEYNCWADVTDSDHKPVYAILEANLPITDQAKKRGVCSLLLKECAAASARGGGAGPGVASPRVDEEAAFEEEGAAPRCSLAPSHVKLHPSAVPTQMVLLRNEGSRPLLFWVACEGTSAGGGCAGGATWLGRPVSDDEAAAAAAHQLLEVRPMRGLLLPGEDAALQVHLAGSDEWTMRGVEHSPELTYRVHVAGEYSSGGELVGQGATDLQFTVTCLTHL